MVDIEAALSSLYLAWSAGAKLYADDVVRDILAREGVDYEHLQTQPTPFNTLLWRVVGVNGDRYFEGLWSLVSPEQNYVFAFRVAKISNPHPLPVVPSAATCALPRRSQSRNKR